MCFAKEGVNEVLGNQILNDAIETEHIMKLPLLTRRIA